MKSGQIRERKVINSLVNTVLVVVLALFMAIDQAVLYLQPLTGLYRYSAPTDFLMKPNVKVNLESSEYAIEIATNSLGLRDDEPDPAADRKILILGDSFVFGYGVDHRKSFAYVFEQGLKRRFGERYEVINGGHTGYDTRRELELFRSLLPRLSPSAAIVTFFINDPLSNSGEFFFLAGANQHLSPSADRWPFDVTDLCHELSTETPVQTRLGRFLPGGRTFRLFASRTMHRGLAGDGALF